MRLWLLKETSWCLIICICLSRFLVLAAREFEESSAVKTGNGTAEIIPEITVRDTSTNTWTETEYTTDISSSTVTEQNDLNETSPGITIGSSTTARETFPPGVTDPTVVPTELPAPSLIEATNNTPGWAIGLISFMVIVSLALTGVIFVRRYCLRKRREERRYLLARSQEGFFFGETNSNFNENL